MSGAKPRDHFALTLGDLNSHPVRKLIGKELADPWRNEWFADGHGRGRGDVVERQWKRQRSGDRPWPRHPARMTGACMASGLFGVLVPLTLRRFGADPCTASSIFLTTGTDIAGMGLMLGLATVLVL